MILCLGERLDRGDWTGLPLGRFSPPGHESPLPVAATQDTLFVWCDGASAARVKSRHRTLQYARHEGVCDLMAADEEVVISHLRPESPGMSLLVALPSQLATRRIHSVRRAGRLAPRFGLTDPHLVALARALEHQCLEGEPFGRIYSESISLALTSYIAARYYEQSPTGIETIKAGKLPMIAQRRLQAFVEANLSKDLGVADLAQLTSYSDQHFARLFRRTFGVSPHQFVVQARMDRAKQMLREGRESLSEVAIACGFSNQSYFSTVFMRTTGLTPGRYRERI